MSFALSKLIPCLVRFELFFRSSHSNSTSMHSVAQNQQQQRLPPVHHQSLSIFKEFSSQNQQLTAHRPKYCSNPMLHWNRGEPAMVTTNNPTPQSGHHTPPEPQKYIFRKRTHRKSTKQRDSPPIHSPVSPGFPTIFHPFRRVFHSLFPAPQPSLLGSIRTGPHPLLPLKNC